MSPRLTPNFNLGHSTLHVSTILSITERYERRKARDHIRDAADHSEEMGVLLDGDLDMDTGVSVLDAEVQTDHDHDDVSLLRSSLNDALQQFC